jgi:uncharacterized protein (TIGR03118 family)
MTQPRSAARTRLAMGRRARQAAVIVTAGALTALGVTAASAGASPPGGTYQQINMVSDVPGVAPLTDPDLVNAWGLSASPSSPLWVSDNGTDKTTLYQKGASPTTVTKVPTFLNGIDVTSGAPTGQVFNTDSTGFVVHDAAGHSAPSLFIFASENGGIDGWNPTVGVPPGPPSTVTEVAVNNGANAVYKGLAIAVASDGHTYLYAANFRSGRVEAYDDTFTPVELPGGFFVDPKIPVGFAPFNVQELAGQLYVSYAKQDSGLKDDVAGQGNGFVDVFTNDGAFVKRLVTRGQLNSPWGLALAPASFGRFGGALLVGNFGDGTINAYDINNGARLGQLRGIDNKPIAIDGLWGLRFGNGNAAGTNELIFSAGPEDESHGLLGKIVAGS